MGQKASSRRAARQSSQGGTATVQPAGESPKKQKVVTLRTHKYTFKFDYKYEFKIDALE